ncbi:hypothetical protein [Alteribacter populi]|uniref:hypothetical protein n=1 Tax=Alteribacter populi TaxID=2011011 RepID=UPI000BBA8654|nr:hypothetical protein [Alteribacter populi]
MYYRGPSHPYYRPEYPYPPINISLFQQSLLSYQELLQHGAIVLNSLVSSPKMMHELMYYAQAGNDMEVDRVIKATGVPSIVETSYTPNSVTFKLFADADVFPNCCTLTMNLIWGHH